jgi:kinesin family protein 4/21/27
MGADRDAAIKVAVRCRIFLPFEIKQGNTVSVVNVLPGEQIKIKPPQITSLDESRYQFTFDATYGDHSTQADVFKKSIKPLVNACMEGYNSTVIAYGQTGSGKTHTILGQTDQSDVTVAPEDDTSEAGVIPRALRDLFQQLAAKQAASTDTEKFEYDVNVQFLELYGEDVRDLLQADPSNAPKLRIQDGTATKEPEVIGIKTQGVDSAEDALLCLTRGTLRRVTRATAMNAESSRSHAMMTVLVSQKTIRKVQGEDGKMIEEKSERNSKFNFVDLAGSERIKRTHATGQGIKEGININKGLLILGNVISALASQGKKKDSFVPYRDSKLTRLLRGSLGGNHKTLMVACVSPSGSNTEESLNTLRYANRAKNIQNKAVINMDAGSKMIADLRANLKAMATELLRVRSMVADGVELDGPDQVFTEPVLKALAGGGEVDLKLDDPGSKPSIKKAKSSVGGDESAFSEDTGITEPSTVAGTSAARSSSKPIAVGDGKADSEELRRARDEIKKLKRALEKSDDRVLESERELEWMKEELKISKEEVMALAAVDKSSDGDSDASNVSALTEDFENMPRLSKETYEVSVKIIFITISIFHFFNTL